MKQWKKVMGALAFGAVFAACAGDNGAQKAMEGYLASLQKGDYKAFVDGMKFKETPTEEEKEQFASLIELKGKELEANQFKVTGDSVLVEDSLIVVFYDRTDKEGKVTHEEQIMVKSDGKWLMNTGK